MDLTQLLLIAAGLAIAAGGVVMLIRSAAGDRRAEAQGRSVRPRPYVPLGVVAVGLIIAYHSFSDFTTFQPSDVAIMFLFALALAALLSLRFFIVDKTELLNDDRPKSPEPSDKQ